MISRPAKYLECLKEIKKRLCKIEFKDINNPLAFAYRNIGSRVGDNYKIVCNNKSGNLIPFLLLHESGHILFNHCKVDELETFLVNNKIKTAWDKIKKYFDNKTQEDVYKYFENYVYNIVMDWEVNSKLFTEEEIENFETLTRNYLNAPEAELCYPTRMGYPAKKNWLEYITLITLDPEKFLKENQSKSGNGDKNKSDQDGEGESDQGGEGESSQDQGDKELKKAAKDLLEKMKETYDKEIDKEKKISENSMEDLSKEASGQKNTLSNNDLEANEINLEVETTSENLVSVLLSLLKKEVRKDEKLDILYHYNRNRFNTNVMYTKRRPRKQTKKNNICVLLDVSGSNDIDNIRKFVDAFKKVSDILKKGFTLILWNTKLVAEYNNCSSDEIVGFYSGGTNMASGLKYIEEGDHKKDTIFLVSDFCDNVDKWKFDKKIYGICWEKEALKNIREENSCEEAIKKLFYKIITINDKGR